MEIQTTNGQIILIDDADFDLVKGFSWRAKKKGSLKQFYAYTTERGTRREIAMHRLIMDAPRSMMVDHVNRKTLDNRRSNLRLATNAENQMNKVGSRTTGRRFKGVYPVTKKSSKPWWAAVRMNRKSTYLGVFATEEEAARAYDVKARELFGDRALLNFPDPL